MLTNSPNIMNWNWCLKLAKTSNKTFLTINFGHFSSPGTFLGRRELKIYFRKIMWSKNCVSSFWILTLILIIIPVLIIFKTQNILSIYILSYTFFFLCEITPDFCDEKSCWSQFLIKNNKQVWRNKLLIFVAW